jgi:hypothetical protein
VLARLALSYTFFDAKPRDKFCANRHFLEQVVQKFCHQMSPKCNHETETQTAQSASPKFTSQEFKKAKSKKQKAKS